MSLRSNILAALAYGSLSNSSLYASYIANPGLTYSLRAIQEATQKLTAAGVLSVRKSFFTGKKLFSVAKSSSITVGTLSTGTTASA